MLQSLLADRFRLQLHHEMRTVPGYTLAVAKGGIKATPADHGRHSAGNGGRGFIDSMASQLSALTITLSALLGRPVVDMTGDNRKFDFHLKWTPDDTQTGADSATSDSPSLFTALQEQLGLKLESQKVQADVLVVDRAELPSDNQSLRLILCPTRNIVQSRDREGAVAAGSHEAHEPKRRERQAG